MQVVGTTFFGIFSGRAIQMTFRARQGRCFASALEDFSAQFSHGMLTERGARGFKRAHPDVFVLSEWTTSEFGMIVISAEAMASRHCFHSTQLHYLASVFEVMPKC